MSDQAQPNGRKSSKPLQLHGIMSPHEHDVLSGRGNFVNYHAGNEHFRALVRKHKMAYVACPKPQKGKFSRLIVDEIRNRDPPGRFLKQDGDTKLWHDIGDKKALDKTRQALREGAPELLKELQASDGEDEIPTPHAVHKVREIDSFLMSWSFSLVEQVLGCSSIAFVAEIASVGKQGLTFDAVLVLL